MRKLFLAGLAVLVGASVSAPAAAQSDSIPPEPAPPAETIAAPQDGAVVHGEGVISDPVISTGPIIHSGELLPQAEMAPSCAAPVGMMMPSTCGCGMGTCGACCGAAAACGVCGTGSMCCDMCGIGGTGMGGGVDVKSLTTKAQSKKLLDDYQARIKFKMPPTKIPYVEKQIPLHEMMSVALMDVPMSTQGRKRSFVVPIPDQKKTYEYKVKVDLFHKGETYFVEHTIKNFKAGMIVELAVAAKLPPSVAEADAAAEEAEAKNEPPPEEIESVKLKIEEKIVEPGGLPKKKEAEDSGAGDEEAGEDEKKDDRDEFEKVPAEGDDSSGADPDPS